MVLEGLKRAEQFIALLRRTGYERLDKRSLKPEYFDSDFENKKYTCALQSLLDGIDKRSLNEAELSRLDFLAAAGLLEGIDLHSEDVIKREKGRDILHFEELCKYEEELIDRLTVEEELYKSLMKNEQTKNQNMSVDVSIPQCLFSLRDGESLIADFQTSIHSQVERLILVIKELLNSLQGPIITCNDPQSEMRWRTVENKELIQQEWPKEDYEFYYEKMKIALKELDLLNIEHPSLNDLLSGEELLTKLRSQYHFEIKEKMVKMLGQVNQTIQLLSNIIEGNGIWMEELLNNLHNIEQNLDEYIVKIQTFIDTPIPPKSIEFVSEPFTIHQRSTSLLEDMVQTCESKMKKLQKLAGRLVGGAEEVTLIPPEISLVEKSIREMNMSLSTSLANLHTQVDTIKLALR